MFKIRRRWQKQFLLLLIVGFVWLHPQQSKAQELAVPENPLKGRFVFEQKGCITCHAIKGEGGDIGPDLGQKKFYGSFLQLAGIMLNHAPQMLQRMRELDLNYPEFSQSEMMELIAYLYYLRYLGEPGNLYRGKMLVKEKNCLACHSIAGHGGGSAPAFDKLRKYVSPLYMAQALWNHCPTMIKAIQNMGLKRPTFEKGEIVDLSAYIREASKGSEVEKVYMSPGNPGQGKKLFSKKGCIDCHAVNGHGKNIGPDLTEFNWSVSVTEIAGIMWNHGSEMAALMQEQRIAYPKFTAKEMADLIAYLYFLKFTDKPGNVLQGKKAFASKGCSKCHGPNARGSDIAPDLSHSKVLVSPINMARIMWNHAPLMEEQSAAEVMQWPEFKGTEMRDIYAYLKSLASAQSAKVPKK